MNERTRGQVQVGRDRCPFCHVGVSPNQPKIACDACMAWHHAECWKEYGACAACAASEVAGAPCNWKGWGGGRPSCLRAGQLVEGSQQSLCSEHLAEFERGKRLAAPSVLIVLGLSCLSGSGILLVNVLAIRPIPGMYVTAAAVLASLALYMLWLAWARWPAPISDASSPGGPPGSEATPPKGDEVSKGDEASKGD